VEQFWQDRHAPDDGLVRPKHVELEKWDKIISCISDRNICIKILKTAMKHKNNANQIKLRAY
jgi:hypothetical protein